VHCLDLPVQFPIHWHGLRCPWAFGRRKTEDYFGVQVFSEDGEEERETIWLLFSLEPLSPGGERWVV
jgi:hypothetical protein